jgi:arginyl-tRNA synthetase
MSFIMEQIKQLLIAAVQAAYDEPVDIVLTRTSEQFGDYATNVALQLSKKVGQNPRDVAQKIIDTMVLNDLIASADIAGPGFINIKLTDKALWAAVSAKHHLSLAGQKIVAEYSDPNPFKVLHAGHLYTSVAGDAIANLLEFAGAEVHRVNFGGDVGLHVAKNMWAILQFLGGENPKKLADVPETEQPDWLNRRYVEGNQAYEINETAKAEIINLNKQVYQLHTDNDHDSAFAQIYWTCRQWSYDYFDKFYARLGTKFEKYYPESQTTPLGLKTVKEQLAKGVYAESDGAVVFDGEKYGLHTRVFINSQGLPTYEAKDIGLIMCKWRDYKFDRSIMITGNDIVEYMKVVLKSVEQFMPHLSEATTHLTHGMVKLQGGVKMSSRKGNILRAVDVLDSATIANKEATGSDDQDVVLGAVKYAFLKQRIGGDIIYDPKESVSLQGNSGPYLQYAHARACSILAKTDDETPIETSDLEPAERTLVRKLGEYTEVIDQAVNDLMPHLICTYLYELAQEFNRFYEHNRVIGDSRQAIRLHLVRTYAGTLQRGLSLLGITAPEHM